LGPFLYGLVIFMRIQTLDERHLRIAVGLALESAIVNHVESVPLVSLLYNPDEGRIVELHDRLMESELHEEREIAIWLQPAVPQSTIVTSPANLAAEMREMETLMFYLISRMGTYQSDLNYWMNYIANAHQFLTDGLWIDAKLFLSRAVQASRAPSVEELKSSPSVGREIDIIQKATASYFEEVKGYPIKFQIPEERLDRIVAVQGIMLDMMQSYQGPGKGNDATRGIIHELSSTIRHLMERDRTRDSLKQELTLILDKMKDISERTHSETELEGLRGFECRLLAEIHSLWLVPARSNQAQGSV
jgi:hypothetical protein